MKSTREYHQKVIRKLAAIEPKVLENFADAFSIRLASCRGTCACGQEFYDNCNSYDWDPGERETLIASTAIPLNWAVSFLRFQDKEYVLDCQCWHTVAEKAVRFFNDHATQIARFFSLEKTRKIIIAKESPTIETP